MTLASTLVIAYLMLLITKITGRLDGFCGMLMTFGPGGTLTPITFTNCAALRCSS